MARVIAGQAGGRRLAVPEGRDTRPTSDRAREGLFGTITSVLGSLAGARVLDLYAGSGAVGLEALSRGAEHVLLVESGARAARVIRQNIEAIGLDGAEVVADRVERVLARGPAGGRYDVAFADPPYAMSGAEVTGMLAGLAARGWLAPGALVIVERATRSGALRWPPGFVPERARRYGEATIWYGLGPGTTGPSTGLSRLAGERRRWNGVQRVVCPGSFDPVTHGHLDIIGRAAGLYDEVIVAVLINVTKRSLFTVDERVEILGQVTAGYGNVRIERFHGLLVDFCAVNGITAVIKGLRAVSDFEYEMQMAQMNYRMAKVETLFMTTNPLYSFLRSSLVKEIARYGGDVSGLVPDLVLSRLRERLAEE